MDRNFLVQDIYKEKNFTLKYYNEDTWYFERVNVVQNNYK